MPVSLQTLPPGNTIDPTFYLLIAEIAINCDKLNHYLSADSNEQMRWMVPHLNTSWKFRPTEIPQLGTVFNRDGVNEQYRREFARGGENKVRSVMAASTQIGYMGMMERAFRERHKTPVRAFIHFNGRMRAHGNFDYGVHMGAVIGHVNTLYSA